ncbi:hypothetical protein ACFCQI_01730 [Rhodanobacter sp. FW102-FHT14D06]|uniref:Uncharacterized protein n=2 Tax=unclassified Rhodanobacter TaxID=2621553 RepID=A0AB74UXU0_9GAMM
MNIIDHGHDDPIPFELSESDRAIADQCKHAIAEQRYYLNTRDRLQQRRRDEHKQGGAA